MSGNFSRVFQLFSLYQDTNNEHLEKLIKQYSKMFDLAAPMKGCVLNQGRYLFLEGDMKYKDSISKVRDYVRSIDQSKESLHGMNLIVISSQKTTT